MHVTVNRDIEDPIALDKFQRIMGKVQETINATTTRGRRGIEESVDPRRDIDDECGYPKTDQIELEDYRRYYARNSIAKKVVELGPKHSWQIHPEITEDQNPEIETEFEIAIKELGNNLRGASFYQDDEGDPVWEYLLRLDILSGIGHYGVMLLGVGGEEGKNLLEPLEFNGSTKRELLFLRVFPEWLAHIAKYDDDRTSPRFGLPELYDLAFDDTIASESPGSRAAIAPIATTSTESVHWSRVIHVADQLMSNEVVGVPRMRPVFNRLLDLEKLYGGSGEMYWKGAFPGLSLETHPQLGGDVEVDTTTLKSEMENWMNGLQRYLLTTGMHVNSLSPQVVDPSPQIDVNIEAICIEQDCPKRIFMGSERGELASSQDQNSWASVVQSRRNNYVTPRIIVPFVNRLILLGILPEPKGYSVTWLVIDTVPPIEKADISLKITQSIVAYLAGGGENLMPVMAFLTMILGFTTEEAEGIVEAIEPEDLGHLPIELSGQIPLTPKGVNDGT